MVYQYMLKRALYGSVIIILLLLSFVSGKLSTEFNNDVGLFSFKSNNLNLFDQCKNYCPISSKVFSDEKPIIEDKTCDPLDPKGSCYVPIDDCDPTLLGSECYVPPTNKKPSHCLAGKVYPFGNVCYVPNWDEDRICDLNVKYFSGHMCWDGIDDDNSVTEKCVANRYYPENHVCYDDKVDIKCDKNFIYSKNHSCHIPKKEIECKTGELYHEDDICYNPLIIPPTVYPITGNGGGLVNPNTVPDPSGNGPEVAIKTKI